MGHQKAGPMRGTPCEQGGERCTAGAVLAAGRARHRPGPARALGLRARGDGLVIVPQTRYRLETQTMFLASWFRGRRSAPERTGAGRVRPPKPLQKPAARRRPFLPRLEPLEDRSLPSTLTVVNNLDSGPGSLRAQIAAAGSGDTIVFA